MEDEEQQLLKRRNIQQESVNAQNYPGVRPAGIEINQENDNTNKKGFTGRLALAMAACTMGSSFQFGYNTGIVNAPETVIKEFYNTTCNERNHPEDYCDNLIVPLWSLTVAMYAVGGMIGGVSAGKLANLWGRKRTLLLNNILMIISIAVEISSKYADSYEVLIVGRLIVGVNAGINTGIAPMYLSEISTVGLRGLCGTFNQLCITLGVLTSTVVGLNTVLGRSDTWQYAFGVPLVLVVWQLVALSCCPESPRFLVIQRQEDLEAERALVWLRGTTNVHKEMQEMIAERDAQRREKQFYVCDLFRDPELRKPMVICIIMHLSQQWSGINAVIYYSTSIFMGAGLRESSAEMATLATGAVNSSMTLVSALLMDRLGRRTLHLTGLGGMFIFSLILTSGQIYQTYDDHNWLGIICVMAVIGYIIFFATGPGAIPWFFTAELFAQGSRSAAVSVGVVVNWAANATVGFVFPILQKNIKAYSFIPFVAFLGFSWMFTFYQVPETKGRTIEDITALFRVKDIPYQQIPQHSDSDSESQ
ncbi:solute carrier family 2, facilitated glucose transporter member 3-like [Dreissena polymorpha]|uniref:solute carrier family 2, facilitated glucose transporter member 3-like n=1 Tax=Dreissena polymorpha TaxID=45954 RepID=UPI002265065B|nr:solute carrier family 2, facilitated glucose transporter member 3-like [Dreissena polymorpha]